MHTNLESTKSTNQITKRYKNPQQFFMARRERNRLAAQKLRKKHNEWNMKLELERQKLEVRNQSLKNLIVKLEKEMEFYIDKLFDANAN